MKNKLKNNTSLKTLILISVVTLFAVINLLLLWSNNQQHKTLILLREQLELNQKDQAIISASESLSTRYAKEIDVISKVFPDEGTMPEFIRYLEDTLRSISAEYSIKFNSSQPITEDNKLFLPITIIVKTNIDNYISFLDKLEKMPYMTHVTLITITAPDGFSQNLDVRVTFKVYVKKPFTTQ